MQVFWQREEPKREIKRWRALLKEFTSFWAWFSRWWPAESIVWDAPFRLWPRRVGLKGPQHTEGLLAELGLATIGRLDKPLVLRCLGLLVGVRAVCLRHGISGMLTHCLELARMSWFTRSLTTRLPSCQTYSTSRPARSSYRQQLFSARWW